MILGSISVIVSFYVGHFYQIQSRNKYLCASADISLLTGIGTPVVYSGFDCDHDEFVSYHSEHTLNINAHPVYRLSSTMMSRLMINLRGTEEIQDVSSNNYSIGIVFAKSLSSTLDEGSYSEDHDGLDDHRDDYYANSLPVHLKLCLPDLNCDERCTREVLKAMGIDVREIV